MSLVRVSGPRERLGERREGGGGVERGRFSPCAVFPVRVFLSPFPQHVNLILILTCLATCIPESGWFCLCNPESWAFESGILLPESRILPAIEIWNLISTEKESGIRNPESKTVLVFLSRRHVAIHGFLDLSYCNCSLTLPTKIAQTEPPHHMSLVALFITDLRRRKWRSVFRFWWIEASIVDPSFIVCKRETAWD